MNTPLIKIDSSYNENSDIPSIRKDFQLKAYKISRLIQQDIPR